MGIDLVKDIKKMAEECKVAVRNARRDGIDLAKKSTNLPLLYIAKDG